MVPRPRMGARPDAGAGGEDRAAGMMGIFVHVLGRVPELRWPKPCLGLPWS
jgi:hypothetical protein